MSGTNAAPYQQELSADIPALFTILKRAFQFQSVEKMNYI
jgi:hypothetical protein